MVGNPFKITIDLVQSLIKEQFPEFSHLPIIGVDKQGHDNRTYRLGSDMLIRIPTEESYALKVPKEQKLLPLLAPHLTIDIPVPLKLGQSSNYFPFPFSIYQWLEGRSINFLTLDDNQLDQLALDLSKFLKELHNIDPSFGPSPGQHNWWRGDHVSVYDKGAREQIVKLSNVIDSNKAIQLWEVACKTKWNKDSVWVHGDFAIGNLLVKDGKLSAVIDFGGVGIGDPACDLVIAWTFFKGRAREIFIKEMALDKDTWLRAKAWALWKATFELCELENKNSEEGLIHKKIIEDLLDL
jgi:aminoglycoside phosphotransferase (APT) family kinase protein